MYGIDILRNMRNWVVGWTDWNLCECGSKKSIDCHCQASIFINAGLDMGGGPNWAKNYVDAPILVNSTIDEFYKQPMFYFIAHFRFITRLFCPQLWLKFFSKFVSRGSIRVESYNADTSKTGDNKKRSPAAKDEARVEHVAFVTPLGNRVLVAINHEEMSVKLSLIVSQFDKNAQKESGQKRVARLDLPPHSIITALWI